MSQTAEIHNEVLQPKECEVLQTGPSVPHGTYSIKMPELSDWKCELFGMKDGWVMYPNKGNVPNRFWRLMQYLCFGNKWSKVK